MAVETHEDHFQSADGSSVIRYIIWRDADVEAKGIVQLAHGVVEYIERYDAFASFLAKNGYVVVGNDHIGHGASAKPTHRLGHVRANGYLHMAEDMHTLSKLARKAHPNLPLILLGHSMGSFLSKLYALYWGRELSGMILCGTGGKNPGITPGLLLIGVVLRVKGEEYQSKFVEDLVFGPFANAVKDAVTPFDWLSKNAENVDRYIADPLCGQLATVSTFKNLLLLMKKVNASGYYREIDRDLPILLASGKEDPVGAQGDGVTEVTNAFRSAGVKRLNMILYPDMRHEILQENGKEKVFSDLLDWIEQTLSAHKSERFS